MTIIRPTRTTVLLALLAAMAAPPLAADRNDDRGEPKLRKAPPASEAPRQAPRPVTPPPRTPTPAPRDLRKDAPRAVPVPRTTPPPRTPTPAPRDLRKDAPRVVSPPPRPVPPPKPPAGYVLDKRHSHNHYYPPRGYIVPSLPKDYRVIRYKDVPYYYYSGIWYRPSGTRYIVVRPPIGLIVPFLPPYFSIVWYGAVPYYYAAGVYYTWYPEYRYYVVAEPPPESEIREQPVGSDQLFIYPKLGQSEEQQARDRYECHSWAVGETGFDPTLPGGNVESAQYASKRSDYLRAMKACLEARGYSVQ